MNSKDKMDYSIIILIIGALMLVFSFIFMIISSRLNLPQALNYVIIALTIFSLIVVVIGLVLGIIEGLLRDFKKYSNWCSNCGFKLNVVNSAYKEYQKKIFKSGASNNKKGKNSFYSDFEKAVTQELKHITSKDDLSFCFDQIQSDCNQLNDIFKTILFPGLLSVVIAFYECHPFGGMWDAMSVIILCSFLIIYTIILVISNECVLDLIKHISNVKSFKQNE